MSKLRGLALPNRRPVERLESPKRVPALLRPRDEVENRVDELIEKGAATTIALNADLEALNAGVSAYRNWREYTRDYLLSVFSTTEPSEEFDRSSPVWIGGFHSVFERLHDHNDDVQSRVRRLISLRERLELFADPGSGQRVEPPVPSGAGATTAVFIVHGRDEALRERVARFLEKLDLNPVILNERANQGDTLIEKLDRHSMVKFAVVLATPDDEGRLRADGEALTPRARENVVFELGYFIGKLGRSGVSVIGDPAVANFSDFRGMVTIHDGSAESWQVPLARELRAAGFEFDMNKAV